MRIRTVRAILDFKTPSGHLRKHVNWSHYESKALLTPSTNSLEAYDKFFWFGKRIIGSSIRELKYLDMISFYEEYKKVNSILNERTGYTDIIKVVKSDDGNMTFRVLP